MISNMDHLNSTVFLDFRDVFGTLSHEVMLQALEEIHLPQPFVNIVSNVYQGSFLQVICGQQLTEPIALKVGIKTVCPWSAVNFILALNQWMKWIYQCAPLHVKSPNPVQGYADDVQVSSRQEDVIINMLARTDEFLQWSGLEVKQAKCAVLHERRSGGNRWYKAKNDKPPSFLVMGQPIKVYSRNETYPYLGHRFNIAGEWGEQVEELTTEFLHRLHLIDLSPLPVFMKFQAVREVALAKIQHLFANVHIPLKALREMTNKTVQLVRKWVGLNTHSTRCIIFLPCGEGGLGVPNVEWTYIATRLAHLIHMLNNDDVTVREMARASLLLDLQRRKIPLASADQNNFLGFRRKDSGKLDSQARGFGVWSDWPDLNDLCNRTGVQLKWTRLNTQTEVPVSDELIADPSVVVKADITKPQEETVELHRDSARRVLLSTKQSEIRQHWYGLGLQGKLACLGFADHSVSHSVFKNAAVGEDVLTFTIKARLQGGKGLYMQLNATAPILTLYANPEACLKKDFRVKRSSVVYLVQMLSSPKDHGWGQDIEVLVLLYSLAHGLSLSVVGSAFGIPKSTVHRIIKHVTGKIKANLKILISLPTSDELPEIADGFCQLAKSPAFHRAAGAIDGCHIHIKPPGNEYHKEYINYKLLYLSQMQAICDSTGRFLDVFIGYPGSVHDARVLRNSPIFCQALFPPAGWFLLGDGGYPCLEKTVGLRTPYKVPRGQVQARFNAHHARARSVVERAFGRMKARWRATLFKALEVSPSFAPDIIACCAFLCIDLNDVLEDAEAFPPGTRILPLPQHVDRKVLDTT
ncbi:uncharacterized protein LOC117555601 [Gymnodraco acuticeps]|uniref:Uncharacterized protein LOC117555601 n=1 Tax=Gymnodraco acuticeps TaxID=8218 RepID=A0A6P8VIV7_GYMAC|nr:uncharacterized protein LOC117555601 [Gymnodraco acuticeps]